MSISASRITGVFVVAVLIFAVSPGHGQTTGTVTGRVLDQTDALIPGASVELRPAGRADPIGTLSGDDGSYRFENVPVGPAELIVRMINFTVVRRSIQIVSGVTIATDVVLNVSASADITITAQRTFRNLAELENPAENLVGVAAAGSEGAITAAQLQTRPLMRSAEVLETVPGMVISQHSGEGKANQYYLRGFNLDHGFDFAQTIAGIPVNMPTHAHAHGYTDANFLIPELVSGVQFRKGPYYAEEGDFSSAGAANINYFNRLQHPILNLSWGSHGYARFLGAVSPELAGGHLLTAFEWNQDDGPWELPNSHDKLNGVLRYSRGDTREGFSITAMGYSSHWNSTDQVPQRAIDGGLIGRFGTMNPSDRGQTYRYSLAADLQRSGINSTTRYTAYLQRYGVSLISDFTYFLDDPVYGDQFEQEEARWVTGGAVTHRRLGHVGDYNAESAFGLEVRNDSIGGPLGLYRTRQAQRIATVRADEVDQFSIGSFAQTQIEWSRILRMTFGLRGDFYHYDVRSDNVFNSGQETMGILSPKVSAVFGPWNGTEIYLNGGLGFHSNSALGATLAVDPVSGEPAERSTPIARARGAEVGIRTVRLPGLQTTATLWYLGFDSELLFAGDAGTTVAGRPSRRIGLEITNYARLHPWVTADLDFSFSRARFTGEDAAGDFVPGSLDRVISMGILLEPPEGGGGPFGSLRLRHFGPRPLIEDNSVRSQSTSIVNGALGYRFSDQLRLVGEIYNLFDAEVSDIDYFYTSRLPGEPAEGVADIHLHPALPRSIRVALQVSF